MAAIPGIMVDIGANVARMQQDMRRLTGTMNQGFSQIHSMALRLGTVLAGALSVKVLVNFAKEALDTGDKMAKLSQSTGTSVEILSSLNYAAKLSNVELESLAKSMGILSRNMLDAQTGTGEAKEAIKALGLSIEDSSGNLLASDKVLSQVADKFAGMKDGATKTALAMKIFGRSGAEMIPLLNQGAEGLAQMREEAEKLGLVLSAETAQQMERVNDNFTRMKSATQGAAIGIMTELAPTLENLTNIFIDIIKQEKDFSLAAEAGATALKALASAAVVAATALADTGKYWGALGAAFLSVTEGDISVAIKILTSHLGDSVDAWSGAIKIIERIWDKNAENALKYANRTKKALAEGPKLSGEADKQAEAIQKIIEKLFEQAEAMQMGADALELQRKGLHYATEDQKAYALELIKTIKIQEETEAAKKQIQALELQALTFGLTARQAAIYAMQLKQIDPQLIKTADQIWQSIEAMQAQAEQLEKTKAIDKQIEGLRMQALSLGITEKAAILYQMVIQGATSNQVELARSLLDSIEAQKKQNDIFEEARRITESLQTPLERHIEYMDRLQKLHDAGAISIETYKRAADKSLEALTRGEEKSIAEREQILLDFGDRVRAQNRFTADAAIFEIERQAEIFRRAGADEVAVAIWASKEKQKASRDWQDGAMRGLEEYAANATNAAKNTEQVFTNAFQSMEDALVEFATTGKISFKSLIDSMIKDIMRLMIRQTVTGRIAYYLAMSVGSLFSGGWGGGGTAGGGPGTLAGSEYNMGLAHTGAVIGETILPIIKAPASMIASAPRYHQGLKPDEFPTILQKGEGVFTPEQMKALGNKTTNSMSFPINAGGIDSRRKGQLSRDLEKELEPLVKKIVGRYL